MLLVDLFSCQFVSELTREMSVLRLSGDSIDDFGNVKVRVVAARLPPSESTSFYTLSTGQTLFLVRRETKDAGVMQSDDEIFEVIRERVQDDVEQTIREQYDGDECTVS